MGGNSRYSEKDYAARTTYRGSTARTKGISIDDATFAYDHAIRSGKTSAAVHPTLDPRGVKIRECRDSLGQEMVPVGITLDTTGSMADVPKMIQKALPKLMGAFLSDKAHGRKYLGANGYPSLLFSAVDDWHHGCRAGAFQVGQFENGLEFDDNLSNLWLTGDGGGGPTMESYDIALYFAAYHTAHDHYDKRGKRGYWFVIGDEMAYSPVSKEAVGDLIQDGLQADVPLRQVIEEAQKLYHVFYIMPKLTNHWGEAKILNFWRDHLPQGHCIELEDPNKVCECIVSLVAMTEGADLDDLVADGVALGLDKALVPLSKADVSVAHHANSLVERM